MTNHFKFPLCIIKTLQDQHLHVLHIYDNITKYVLTCTTINQEIIMKLNLSNMC